MPTLILQLPGLPPVSHTLKEGTMTLGRMRGNSIVIDDDSVSLMHAKIIGREGAWLVKDMNSTNGTLLNGQSVTESPLRDNDKLVFGDVSGWFSMETIAETSQAAVTRQQAPSPRAESAVIPSAAGGRAGVVLPAFATGPVVTPLQPRRSLSLFSLLLPYAGAVAIVAAAAFLGFKAYNLSQDKSADRTNAKERARLLASSLAPDAAGQVPLGASEGSSSNSAIPTDARISQLTTSLKNQDVSERRRAAKALHSLGDEAQPAAAALREALSDSDQEVQIWSALTLINNRVYDKATVPICVRALQHENSVLRQIACLSLGLIPYDEKDKQTVVPALKEVSSKDVDEDVRKAAASALAILAPENSDHAAAK